MSFFINATQEAYGDLLRLRMEWDYPEPNPYQVNKMLHLLEMCASCYGGNFCQGMWSPGKVVDIRVIA